MEWYQLRVVLLPTGLTVFIIPSSPIKIIIPWAFPADPLMLHTVAHRFRICHMETEVCPFLSTLVGISTVPFCP